MHVATRIGLCSTSSCRYLQWDVTCHRQHQREFELLEKLLTELTAARCKTQVRQPKSKTITANTCTMPKIADIVFNTLSHSLEQLITSDVAIGIVYFSKVVNIYTKQTTKLVSHQSFINSFKQRRSVEQAGQVIVCCPIFQITLPRYTLAQIPKHYRIDRITGHSHSAYRRLSRDALT